jgi:hypothetical protein
VCRCREVNIEPVPNRVRIAMMFSTSMQSTVSFYMFLPPCSQPSPSACFYLHAVNRLFVLPAGCEHGCRQDFFSVFPDGTPRLGCIVRVEDHAAQCIVDLTIGGLVHVHAQVKAPKPRTRDWRRLQDPPTWGLIPVTESGRMGGSAHKKPREEACMQMVLHRCAWPWRSPWPGRREGVQ